MGVCYCCATDDVRINVMHWVVITVYGRKGKGMGKEWVTGLDIFNKGLFIQVMCVTVSQVSAELIQLLGPNYQG